MRNPGIDAKEGERTVREPQRPAAQFERLWQAQSNQLTDWRQSPFDWLRASPWWGLFKRLSFG